MCLKRQKVLKLYIPDFNCCKNFKGKKTSRLRGPFGKFVDWQQLASVRQREAVTVTPSCSGGGNVVMV
jgi:hypothetical protein